MTISQLRRRIDALKRKLAPQLAIIKLRRLAEDISGERVLSQLPEPPDVIQRIAKAGFRLPTFVRLHSYLEDVQRRGEVPVPNTMVLSLLPWAENDRYAWLLRYDLPPQPNSPRPRLLPF